MRRRVPDAAVTLASMAALLLAWVLLTTDLGSGPAVGDLFLPGPGELWSGAADLLLNGYHGRPLLLHVAVSLGRVLVGFATGALAGTLLGLLMGRHPRLDAVASVFLDFFRPLPQLGYLVLLIIWFGIGEASRVVLLFLTALPVAAAAARDGVRSVPPGRIQVAHSLGASERQILRHVVLPSALEQIFLGARLAAGIVYGTLIAAEIVAGSAGIGWMIVDAGRFLRSDYVVVGIALIGAGGLLLDRLILAVQARVVHWAGR